MRETRSPDDESKTVAEHYRYIFENRVAIAVVAEGPEREELRVDWSNDPPMMTISINRLLPQIGPDGKAADPVVRKESVTLSPNQVNHLVTVLVDLFDYPSNRQMMAHARGF